MRSIGLGIRSKRVWACGRCGQERASHNHPDAVVCSYDACDKLVRAPSPQLGRAVILDKGEDDQHRRRDHNG